MQSYGIDTEYINKHMHIQVLPNRYEHIQNIQVSKYTYRSFIEYINLNIVLHIFSKKCKNTSKFLHPPLYESKGF
jgi:phage-related protein